MAGTKKSKKRSKKSGKSKTRGGPSKLRACRSLNTANTLSPNWFQTIRSHSKEDPRRNLQEEYRAALNLSKCRDFKREVVPCKFLAKDKLHTYAALCKIKGRSQMSQKALCASLMRRTKTKPFGKRCANKRLSDLVEARFARGLPYNDIKIKAFRQALGKGNYGRHETKLRLVNLIASKNAELRVARENHKQNIKEIEAQGKAKISALKEAGASKEDIKDVKDEVKQAVQLEHTIEQQEKQKIKDEKEQAEQALQALKQDEKAMPAPSAPLPLLMPPLEPYTENRDVPIRKISKGPFKSLINRWQLPDQVFPPGSKPDIKEVKLYDGVLRLYDADNVSKALEKTFREHILDQIDRGLRETYHAGKSKNLTVKDVLGFILELPLEANELPYVYVLAQIYLVSFVAGDCGKSFTLKYLDKTQMLSQDFLKDFRSFDRPAEPLFFDIYPDNLLSCMAKPAKTK